MPSPVLSIGLRTVTGIYNNLLPGQENFGTAGQPFPRLTTPSYREGEPFDPDGPGPLPATLTSYLPIGTVVDSSVRVISNLIADNSSHNPAAVEASGFNLALGADGIADTADDNQHVDDVFIANTAPDLGLSAPFNGWMTLFGQFFDHGLDLVAKGDAGTVFIPLMPDDPLYVPGSQTNFMVLTRATRAPGEDGVLGTADDTTMNKTSPFVDQNQTYTSHPSHQVLLREYAMVDGKPVATGALLDGAAGGLASWGDIKAQARDKLGIDLTDADVANLPLLATDEYGRFLRGPGGFVQVVMQDGTLQEGDPANPISLTGAVRAGVAALDDIAHAAVPFGDHDGDRATPNQLLTADADNTAGNTPGLGFYDDELLDAHFSTGDGRGNENIGLTAVHTIFHSEHNRMVDQIKDVVLATGDAAFIAEWLVPGANAADGVSAAEWSGERLFQAAKFSTEMQYQHLVFEEFARKIAPQTDILVAYDVTMNPAIVGEFAHTVYRFGHSMLTGSIDRLDPNFNADHIGLIEAFLNPVEFDVGGTIDAGVATGAIVRGMTRQVGNQIDEFVVGAVRSNLLGLPLDLPALNLARGRDTGMPTLNEARREFFAGTHDSQLTPYTSWADFAGGLTNEASIINFIAAYGTHQSILGATTVAGKRDAAMLIVLGGTDAPADRLDFLNSEGAWANGTGGVTTTGLDDVDLWIGGLAEKKMPFGGMLGSTFAIVFENQMEALQSSDRFYYLARTAGLNFLNELEQNSFASLIMKNSDATHLPADVFSTPGLILEVDRTQQFNAGLGNADPTGGTVLTPLVIRNDPATSGTDTHYLRYTGDQHVVLGGTAAADTLIASEGDDAIYGDGGHDRVEGGFGNDHLDGGDGNDVITDRGGDDVIKGNAGHDVIQGGNGINLIIGGTGSDFIVTGEDSSEVFGGQGNDFLYGSVVNEGMLGNEGDDWIEIGTQDGAPGDNFDPFGRDAITGNDVFLGDGGFDEFVGEGGDDIMVGSFGINRNEGMSGYDWVTYKDMVTVRADLLLAAFDETPLPPSRDTAIDRYAEVEGLSGSSGADVLMGDHETAATLPLAGARGSVLTNIDLIGGLRALLPTGATRFDGGNIILGGNGSDQITGRGGDDIIDGDRWLNVRISARTNPLDASTEVKSATSMKQLEADMFNRVFNPSQLVIVREIVGAIQTDDIDVALYSGLAGEYDITSNLNGSFTVAHARGTQADGTDTLWNIERLRFGNGAEMELSVNTAAFGDPVISDQTPTEGTVLTVSASTIEDPNGFNPATVTFRWQASTDGITWTEVATGTSFTPTQAQVAQQLRVVASFVDNGGFSETRTSLATVMVGDRFIGSNAVADSFAGTGGADFANGLAANDTLSGGAQADTLLGGTGDDSLFGGAGDDILQSGSGRDRVDGGTGADTMTGGVGQTIFVVDDALDQVVELPGGGVDTVLTGLSSYTLGTALEWLTFTGAGPFVGTGNGLANSIQGGAGADTLDGGAGADTLTGGAGNDLYKVDSQADIVSELAGGGTDTVEVTAAVFTARLNVEHLTFTGAGTVSLTGNAASTILIAGSLADVLAGLGGNDTLFGMDGADAINAGTGNDRITGGTGDDTLTGSSGTDTFVFAVGLGQDRLTDFDANPSGGQDRLDIAAMGVTAADFAGLVTIEVDGLDTLITLGSDSIRLVNVAAATVTQGDFILA